MFRKTQLGILLAFFYCVVAAKVSSDVKRKPRDWNSGWASKASSSSSTGNGWNSKGQSGSETGTGSGWSSGSSSSNTGWNSIAQGSGWAAVNSHTDTGHSSPSSSGGGWQSQSSSSTPVHSNYGFDWGTSGVHGWSSSVNVNEPPIFENLEPIFRVLTDFVSWLFSSPPPPPPPPSSPPLPPTDLESGNFSQPGNDTNNNNNNTSLIVTLTPIGNNTIFNLTAASTNITGVTR